MIVFCGDSFCQPDDYPWNWMHQVSKKYKDSYVSLGKDAVSNFDIMCQVEHAVSQLDYKLLVVCLTTIDRLEIDHRDNSELVPATYNLMRESIESNTLTALYRKKYITNDMLPFLSSIPINLKKNEVYIEHIINLCKSVNKPFIIFNNIFPIWRNTNYVHRLKYIVDGPASAMEEKDFLPKSKFDALHDGIIERQIPVADRSCHLTISQSVSWAERAINYIDKEIT
jgi:hypothetical protein